MPGFYASQVLAELWPEIGPGMSLSIKAKKIQELISSTHKYNKNLNQNLFFCIKLSIFGNMNNYSITKCGDEYKSIYFY